MRFTQPKEKLKTPEEWEEMLREIAEKMSADPRVRHVSLDEYTDPTPLPWPKRFQRVFRLLQIPRPPVLHAFNSSLGGGFFIPEKNRVLVTTRAHGLTRDHIMLHEIAHVTDGRRPPDWNDRIEATKRNRIIRQQCDAGRFYYMVRPVECWAYAVTQYLAKSEPWVDSFVTGRSAEAAAARNITMQWRIPRVLPLLPFWSPGDFNTLEPVVKQALGILPPKIATDLSYAA